LRSKRLVVVAALILLVGSLVVCAALFTKIFDTAEYDSFDAGRIAVSALPGPYVSVAGTVEGLGVDESESPRWSGDLDIENDRGELDTHYFNSGTRFDFPPQSQPASDTPWDTSNFPHRVLGFRFEGRAKVVRTGLFGLFRHSVLVDGRFIHPGS
jgi:hypothetical protein